MKRIISVLKNNFKIIAALIIGMLLAGTGVYAATTLASSSVAYDNSKSGGSSTNVKGALDELYDMASTHCPDDYLCKKLEVGTQVSIGDERFYVIGYTSGEVTLLSKYNIDTVNLVQGNGTTGEFAVAFSSTNYWADSFTSSPYNLTETGEPSSDHYAAYAAYKYGEKMGGTGRLLSYIEANNLAKIKQSLIYTTDARYYWLASAYSTSSLWVVHAGATQISAGNSVVSNYGVRPVVVVSRDIIE